MRSMLKLVRTRRIAVLFALLFLFSPLLAADDAFWVRVHHGAEEVSQVAPGLTAALEDYGRFQWGQVSSGDLRALENQGLRVVTFDNPFEMVLGGERYDPLQDDPAEFGFAPYEADPSGDWHIVQFQGPIRSAWLRDLRATGMKVVQPVYPFSYVVWADQAQIEAAQTLRSVRWSGPKLPEHRVQPDNRGHDGEVRPTMTLVSRHDLRNAVEQIQSAGAVVHSNTRLSQHYEVLHLDVAGDRYMTLAQIPGVYTVQYIQQDAGPRGEMRNQVVVDESLDTSDDIDPGYLDWLNPTGHDGSGVIVGIVDGGVNESHPDLTDNIVPCLGSEGSCTTSSSHHGSHVASAVAGTGASGTTDANGFLRGLGMAPGAGLVNQGYQPFLGAGPGGMVPEGMLSIYKDSAESGALLTNNSWGPTGTPQGYDIPTMEIDFISRDALPDEPGHSPVLAVWSIMNGNGDSGGTCAPSSLGSPDEAKNLFGVGSTELRPGTYSGQTIPDPSDIRSLSFNSGHGPACDGRTVPDIVAPGCGTDGASTGTGYGISCGTSMASPVVSGAVALWAERYIDETGTNPSPALMKAVFIAAARNLEGGTNADGGTLDHRPDRFQGFGQLDLDAVMNPAGDFVYLMDQEEVFTETGQDWSLGLNAADPNEPMKIVLTWTDAPGHGDGGTAPAWVNILDLVVDANDGNTYLGNVIGPDGWSEPGGSPDGMNNTEGVWLQPSQHQGGIDLNVLATEIAGDALNPYDPGDPSQDFAIACYNCIIGDPTFSLSLDPQEAGMCVPDSGSDDAVIDISVGQIGDYSGTVALSTAGEPTGVSSVIDPDSVEAPGDSVWTLTIDDTASAGFTEITLSGDDGEDVHTAELGLLIDETLTEGPDLNAPGDGASDTSLQPQFDWDGLPDVTDYRIQVATDAGFGDMVIDEIIEDATSFVPDDELDTGTEYFWRVQGLNLCDDNAWSDPFSFTTRLEPVAEFSADSFSFTMVGNDTDSEILEISNTGTGNLTFDIETDTIDTNAGGRFEGDFHPDNWELVNDPAGVGGSVDVEDGPPVEVYVTGGDDGTGGDTDFQIEIPMDGTITFDWGYQTSDTGCWDSGGYAINGVFTELACNEDAVPYFEESATVEVSQGDIFAFRVNTNDGLLGAGVFGVTNFEFTPDACGDDITPPAWLSVDPSSGSVPESDSADVTITVDSAGLGDGDYFGMLCVSTNAENAPLVPMAVELTVEEGPEPTDPVADITPESLAFEVLEDGADSDTLFIANVGGGELAWAVDTAEPEAVGYRYDLVDVGNPDSELPQGASRAMAIEPQGQAPARMAGTLQTRAITGDFDEGFEDVDLLPGAGWVLQNNSDPLGASGWFQGNDTVFPAHEGADDAYIAANFANTEGSGTISNWLLTPEFEFNDGTEITFWTREPDDSDWADRLQVRLSTAGASDDVGSDATDVGDFTELLLEINESQSVGGYPDAWTEYTITLDDSHAGSSGRLAFRYYVEDGGSSGSASDYIGIDTFSVTQPGGAGGCQDLTAIDWLTATPESGSTDAGDTSEVTVMVDADGLSEGDYDALLCVTTNDPDNELVEVPVTMTVTGQDPAVLDVDPTDLAFGALNVGDDATQSFTVSNVADPGAMSLELSALDLSGDGEFAITGGDCAVGSELEPGESCSVEVTFTPSSSDAFSGQVDVASTDGQSDTVTLSGEGAADPAELGVSPTELDFGEVPLGQSSAMSVTVSNTADAGAMNLELSALDLSGDGEFSVTGGDCAVGSELEPGESCTVEVTFEPAAEVASTGSLSVETADSQSQAVALDGEGVELPDDIFQDRFEEL